MIRTSRLPPSMAALHNNPRHSLESDYMGLWGKKKFQWGLRSIMLRRLCSGVILVFYSCFLYYYFIKDLMFYFQDSSFFDS